MTNRIDTQYYSILCADIVGSTHLYEALGDIKARELIATWIAAMTRFVESQQGEVCSNIGDEILCLFESPAQATAAASEIQQNIQDITGSGHIATGPARIKIGLHCGRVLSDKDGISGDNIKVCRWICSLAKAEQILMSGQLLQELSGVYQSMARFVVTDQWNPPKGDRFDIHEMLWTIDDLTAAADMPVVDSTSKKTTVSLSYAEQSVALDFNSPLATVGRHPGNHLVVDNHMASRLHFTITLKRRRCVLEDKSTNGTWLVDGSGNTHLVHHDSYPLTGQGSIYLAPPDDPEAGQAISYSCSEG